jgi:hypothetical protein
MATDLRGLNNFKKRLQDISKTNNALFTEIANEVAIEGKNIAMVEYANVDDVIVSHETLGNGKSRIIAQGKGIAYLEFGTGRVGENSNYPKEKLPQKGVPLTGNWQYYYPSSYKRKNKAGEEGWYHKFEGETKASFVTGQKAGMQMYRTSQTLKNRMFNIAEKKVKEWTQNV